MNKEGGNFFERHIEKLVVAIAGLACLWLLFSRVLLSPNDIEFEGKKFTPSSIDNYISEEAENLKYKLDSVPKPREAYNKQSDKFAALFKSSITDVNTAINWPIPCKISIETSSKRKYGLPEVNKIKVDKAIAGHIRAVAYVPIAEVSMENPYSSVLSEPNDIDLVTIEAKFDVARLYKIFHDSFAGDRVKEDWRDKRLAAPVFAAVQLQRQELLSDGGWGDWQDIPRAKVESLKKMLTITEDVKELPPGGIKLRMLQFDNAEIRADLLQPESYQIASANKDWFPPSLHGEFVKYIEDLDAQERREALEVKRQERGRQLSERQPKQERGTRESGAGGSAGGTAITSIGGMGGPMGPMPGGSTGTSRTKPRSEREQNERTSRDREKERSSGDKSSISLEDIYDKLEDMLITEDSRLDKMEGPVVFWAHDDTVEPGKSYRYKIRVGVFNPIAGTNQFDKDSEHLKNNVILWSSFSDVTDTIKLPKLLYFFASDIQKNSKTVSVQVGRYILDYWYINEFTVKPGEEIGKIVEYEPSETEAFVTAPKSIDYSTRAVLVDVVPSNDWSLSGGLRERYYFDMLYSTDTGTIEHMPTTSKYWSAELQSQYSEIKKSEKEEKRPLEAWGSKGDKRSRSTTRRSPVPIMSAPMPIMPGPGSMRR